MKTSMNPTTTVETHVIDAKGVVLGRLATQAADLLRGKLKTSFVPHLDMGDKVVIINAAHVKLTGRKLEQKEYYRHTGWLGNLKTETMKDLMINRPEEVIRRAVAGMLPRTRLKDGWMAKLTVFSGAEGESHGR